MAGKAFKKRDLLEKLWDEAETESKSQTVPVPETAPPMNKQSTMRIQITGPTGDTVALQQSQPNRDPVLATLTAEEIKEAEKPAEPPQLQDSEAFSTLQLFHEMGLGGDSEDIFDGIQGIKSNDINTTSNTNVNTNGFDPLMHMQTQVNGLMNGDSSLNAIPESSGADIGLFDDLKASQMQANSDAINNGINDVDAFGNELFADIHIAAAAEPKPIRGGSSGGKRKRRKRDNDDDEAVFENELENIEYVVQEYHETTARKEHDVKDMDSYKEITANDLQQFENMLSNTESLIDEMIEICGHNGYGLDVVNIEDNEAADDNIDDYRVREEALNRNITHYRSYVTQQLQQYNFNLSSNAIVDLMGVKHTMNFRMNGAYRHPPDCCISSQGYVLYCNKRLTPHYYFNVIDYRIRRRIDITVCKIVRDYLRSGHFDMQQFMYPSAEMLKGITPILISHFEEQCKIFYKKPYKVLQFEKQVEEMEDRYDGINMENMNNINNMQLLYETQEDMFCVIVFPNHKAHIEPGIWSRSVTYFDNVIRGTMFQFIENVTSTSLGNGWGAVLLNPNQREIQSESFYTKPKYDDPASSKNTETITIPRNESSFAHSIEIYKHFIVPYVIQKWKCKLLLVSHCDGGNDIINLLETQPKSHKHIIGIAMLDFYNWSLNEFSKKTRQIIEQKAAIYMSLYGSNQSAYGLEPSAAKSPVTIFRTANKEKRYSPCYNTESVIRFFKSKIELNKQK